jgi:hypothetical protein
MNNCPGQLIFGANIWSNFLRPASAGIYVPLRQVSAFEFNIRVENQFVDFGPEGALLSGFRSRNSFSTSSATMTTFSILLP